MQANLDILTEKGQETAKDEQKLLQKIADIWRVDIIETPKDRPAKIDTIIVENNNMRYISENKCRYNMILNDDKNLYHTNKEQTYDSWLITYEKINAGRILAGALCVDFFGFLYLVDQDKVLWWWIANHKGEFVNKIDHRVSTTQSTVNGGVAQRDNAYLPLKHAHYLEDIFGTSEL